MAVRSLLLDVRDVHALVKHQGVVVATNQYIFLGLELFVSLEDELFLGLDLQRHVFEEARRLPAAHSIGSCNF